MARSSANGPENRRGAAAIVAFVMWAMPTDSLFSELGNADTAPESLGVLLQFWCVVVGVLVVIAVSADVPRH
jgi:hypothetical protein